jgi:hypothetical protein
MIGARSVAAGRRSAASGRPSLNSNATTNIDGIDL